MRHDYPQPGGSIRLRRMASQGDSITCIEAAQILGVSLAFFERHVLPHVAQQRDGNVSLDAVRRCVEPMPGAEVLTLEETAARVKVSPRTVLRAIRAGHLEASQLNQGRGGWRIYGSAIERWMERRAMTASSEPPQEPPRPVQAQRFPPGPVRSTVLPSSDGRLMP